LHTIDTDSSGGIEVIAEWADEGADSCLEIVPLGASNTIHLEVVLRTIWLLAQLYAIP
jgi:hypothetical protein